VQPCGLHRRVTARVGAALPPSRPTSGRPRTCPRWRTSPLPSSAESLHHLHRPRPLALSLSPSPPSSLLPTFGSHRPRPRRPSCPSVRCIAVALPAWGCSSPSSSRKTSVSPVILSVVASEPVVTSDPRPSSQNPDRVDILETAPARARRRLSRPDAAASSTSLSSP
jgi:hypothetical protein